MASKATHPCEQEPEPLVHVCCELICSSNWVLGQYVLLRRCLQSFRRTTPSSTKGLWYYGGYRMENQQTRKHSQATRPFQLRRDVVAVRGIHCRRNQFGRTRSIEDISYWRSTEHLVCCIGRGRQQNVAIMLCACGRWGCNYKKLDLSLDIWLGRYFALLLASKTLARRVEWKNEINKTWIYLDVYANIKHIILVCSHYLILYSIFLLILYINHASSN